MTDADGLSDEELRELKSLLEQARTDAERSLSSSTEDAKPVDLGLSIGRLSRVDALQQQHMAMARRQRTERQVEQIGAALARMAAGTYGACIKCGEPIGYLRLRGRPEALVCRDCAGAAP